MVASMRLRHDFGVFVNDAGPSDSSLRSVDGRQIDLMYGYLQGRKLGGFLDFRAGRQFETSGLDWYVFDGGWTRVRRRRTSPSRCSVGSSQQRTCSGGRRCSSTEPRNEPADRAGSPCWAPPLGRRCAVDERARGLSPDVHAGGHQSPTSSSRPVRRRLRQRGHPRRGRSRLVSASMNLMAKAYFTPFAAARMNLRTLRVDDLSAGFGVAVRIALDPAMYLRTIGFDLDSIFNVFAAAVRRRAPELQVRAGSWTLLGRSADSSRNRPPPDLGSRAGPDSRARLGRRAPLSGSTNAAVRTDAFAQGGQGHATGRSVDGQGACSTIASASMYAAT
jgi:hypothetical protein